MGTLSRQHYLRTLIGMKIICILDPLDHIAKGWDQKNVNFKILGDSDISWNLKNSDKYRNFVYAVQFSHSVMYDSLQPCGLQHARLPCPSSTPRACSNSCPSSQWCHPTISSSAVPFSSCLQSFQASQSFPMSQFFASGSQSIEVWASASVLPMNIQGWFPLGLTGLISLQSKGLLRVFSNSTVQKHQFFGTQLSL